MTIAIVARDRAGALGAAVASGPRVASRLLRLRVGVGASIVDGFDARVADTDPGEALLDRIEAGASAAEALAELVLAAPRGRSGRVALLDRRGGVAAHAGGACPPDAGALQRFGTARGSFAVVASAAGGPLAWLDAARALECVHGPLALRLCVALEAGWAASKGGLHRGSAALTVASAAGAVALAVDDRAAPVRELRRLVSDARRYTKDTSR